MFFPVVITSGPVFTADASGNDVRVTKTGWAPLRRNFRAADLSGEFRRDVVEFRLDVVSFPSLDEYLDVRIQQAMRGMREKVLAKIHLFDPEWLLANRGEPEDKDFFHKWLEDVRTRRQWVIQNPRKRLH